MCFSTPRIERWPPPANSASSSVNERRLFVSIPCAATTMPRARSLDATVVLAADGGGASRREADRLGFEVRLEAFRAELAAHARRLEAAERAAEVEREAVDRDRSGADLLRDLGRAIGVGAPHRSGESVLRIVRDPDGV